MKNKKNGSKMKELFSMDQICVQSQKLPITFFPDELKLYKKNLPPN